MSRGRTRFGLLSISALVLWLHALTPALAAQRTGFDHLTTGFELQGAHRDLSCEYCHMNGVFKGTPRTCDGCHTPGSRISATSRPITHISSGNNCALCHAQYNFWPLFRMDHTAAIGTCFSCHNGVTAKGKTPDHIPSDNNCDACHTTIAFSPQRMDHTAVTASLKTACRSCHSGVRAASMSRNHIPTTQQCGDCHTTLAWSPVRFNHSMVSGTCQSCHNSGGAIGKVAGHLATTRDCATCHRYPNWTPVIFVHSSGAYPGDHRVALACSACHASNLDQATWHFATYQPYCAGCHADNYKPQGHDKTTAGVKYTLNELQSCTGACHVYTDATLSTIAKARPAGHHKVTDGAFN